MPEFLEWLFPWSRVDTALKIQLLIWFGSVGFAFWVFVRTILLGKPWLPLKFAKLPDEQDPNAE